jgi:hypothetical protein
LDLSEYKSSLDSTSINDKLKIELIELKAKNELLERHNDRLHSSSTSFKMNLLEKINLQ